MGGGTRRKEVGGWLAVLGKQRAREAGINVMNGRSSARHSPREVQSIIRDCDREPSWNSSDVGRKMDGQEVSED